jgi:hypothetical protein
MATHEENVKTIWISKKSDLYREQNDILQHVNKIQTIVVPMLSHNFCSHGISNGSIPLNLLSKSMHQIQQPNQFDVLCGQDKSFVRHHGNRLLRERTIGSAPLYSTMKAMKPGSGKKKVATRIIKDILHSMQKEFGTRFLRLSNEGLYWEELSDNLAREKVSHSLRTYIKKYVHTPDENSYSTDDFESPAVMNYYHKDNTSMAIPTLNNDVNFDSLANGNVDTRNDNDYINNDVSLHYLENLGFDDNDVDEKSKEVDRLYAAQQTALNNMLTAVTGMTIPA